MTKKTFRNTLFVSTLLLIALYLISFFVYSLPTVSNIVMVLLLGLMFFVIFLQCHYERAEQAMMTPMPAVIPSPHKFVILVIGPYAGKWFNASEGHNGSRYAENIPFILISDAAALIKRLSYIDEHHPDEHVCAFFPFLPDGHETPALITSQLNRWQTIVACLQERNLPCTFALYARLSDAYRPNDKDNASWMGKLMLGQPSPIDLATAVENLRKELTCPSNSTQTDIQRAAMGNKLLNWLEESTIAHELQKMFTQTTLQLTRVVLCDYGRGFSRHGAWSGWLGQAFAILPALSSGASLPPLPPVILPAPISPTVTPPIQQERKKLPRVIWSVWFATLLLAGSLLHASWSSRQQQQMFNQQFSQQQPLETLSIQALQKDLVSLEALKRDYTDCINKISLLNWGLSPCENIVTRLVKRIDLLSAIPTFSSQKNALFNSDSAELNAGANDILMSILTLSSQYPQSRLLIIGHSDNTGSESYNISLARQRAVRVRDWLFEHNIAATRLLIRAVGSTEPVASNDNAKGRQQNRRVEVLVLPVNLTKDGVKPE